MIIEQAAVQESVRKRAQIQSNQLHYQRKIADQEKIIAEAKEGAEVLEEEYKVRLLQLLSRPHSDILL